MSPKTASGRGPLIFAKSLEVVCPPFPRTRPLFPPRGGEVLQMKIIFIRVMYCARRMPSPMQELCQPCLSNQFFLGIDKYNL